MKEDIELGNKFRKLLKEIPLETRILVRVEAAFIGLITELGYRESKMWSPEEDETLGKIIELARELSEDLLEVIEEWEEDGKPLKD